MSIHGLGHSQNASAMSAIGGGHGHHGKKLREMSQEDLTKLKEKLTADGKETGNIDKILENFEKIDADGNGKVSRKEIKAQAEELGIKMPNRGHHRGQHKEGDDKFVGGPPPGFFPPPKELDKEQLSQIQQKLQQAGKDTGNIDKIIENFDKLDADGSGKMSFDELKAGAEEFGIQLPKPPVNGNGLFMRRMVQAFTQQPPAPPAETTISTTV